MSITFSVRRRISRAEDRSIDGPIDGPRIHTYEKPLSPHLTARSRSNTDSKTPKVAIARFAGLKSLGVAPAASVSFKSRSVALAASASRTACATATTAGFKVALLGAAGGIGQPLALLLKMNPMIETLAVYDLADVTPGVAADLSHINTPCKVTAHKGQDQLAGALAGADLVVIPAGIPRKPGMTRDDLFNINAGIVKSLIEGVAANCPNAIVNIISNPVNSTVPIAAEVMKKAGCYDPRKIMGVTTLDIVRANTFVAEAGGVAVSDMNVPVIGGHAGTTILPLLSQASPSVAVADPAAMTTRIQNAGTEVVEAKAGAGSATLSMAYAAARMAESVLLAKTGEKNVVECTYVESSIVEGLPFFSSKVVLGPEGVAEFLPLGELNDLEKAGMEEMRELLTKNIEAGIAFVADNA
jgi:malate dehydrogenase